MTDFAGPRCETCKFWFQEDDSKDGFCRRYPAQVVAVPMMNKKNEIELMFNTRFPVMLPSGWCGEHQA